MKADLDRLAPRIDLDPAQIEVIDGPNEFYEALKSKISHAKRRIYLSTLYIGKTEHELVSSIRQALLHNGPELKVSILTDALRGTREDPQPSCASLLTPLVAEFPERVEIRMYHTPNLTGLRKAVVPQRINEGWGLQHMKLYGIDDEVILSGANLSDDYFTNRQDRYHVFRSKRVTDYFSRIHSAVCSLSFTLQPSSTPSGHELVWPSDNPAPNPLKAPKKYLKEATSLLRPFTIPYQGNINASNTATTSASSTGSTTSTSLYPLIVHPPTLNTELPVFSTLFSPSHTPKLTRYTFAAGYFNPHPSVTSALLSASSPPSNVNGTILTASPYANGFYGSKGISGMLPPAYTHLFSQFLKKAKGTQTTGREWTRGVVGQEGGWTFHAKGVWICMNGSGAPVPPGTDGGDQRAQAPGAKDLSSNADADAGAGTDVDLPSVTLIGSSNYTTRSYGLDLEVGALVVSDDPVLRARWRREEQNLLHYTDAVTPAQLDSEERRAGWRVRLAMLAVKLLGGSL